jgi:tetratricopeptide (TPR) repeat protein
VEQARVLEQPARERVALALEYSDAAGGYEPHESIRAVLEDALALGKASVDRTADDEQQLAVVRIHQAFNLYAADDVEGARALLREGIAALEPGPPTPGRAGLRARLGWTYWRAGPLEQAPPILREAIEEARACGAEHVERMALHDLGIATGMLGDVRVSLDLVEESMDLARAAQDRALMTRCYINVPAIMSGNGETNLRILPLCLEGLERARRSMDHATVSWIAQNVADLLTYEGRLREALPFVEEALVTARTVGEAGRMAVCLGQRAWARLLMGDRDGARSDLRESRRIAAAVEPQSAIFDTAFESLFLWRDDPSTACRLLSDALHSTALAPASLLDAAPIAARMALRLGDATRLRSSVAPVISVDERCGGPVRALQRRWMEALTGDPATSCAALRAVGKELEEIGYRLPAADCHADAAVMAERAGLDSALDVADGRRLYAACGAEPWLGELPETRWMEATETTARPA